MMKKIRTIGLLLVVISLFVFGCATEQVIQEDTSDDVDVEELEGYDDLADDFDDISFEELDGLEFD